MLYYTLGPENVVKDVYFSQRRPENAPEDWRSAPEDIDPTALTLSYLNEAGELVPREGFGEHVPRTCDASGFTLPVLPKDTFVSLETPIGAKMTFSSDGLEPFEFVFSDPGVYEIEIEPPLPYLPTTRKFEVL